MVKLETFFTEEDVKDIYDNVLLYSLLKYQELDIGWKEMFLEKYERAKERFFSRKISPTVLENANLEELSSMLRNYHTIYNSLLQLNKRAITESGKEINRLIITSIGKKKLEIERLSFLFDFITSYVHYSEDYFHYCLDVPPVDGFLFDFKKCVPVDSSIYGMLVMGQGICDDISELFMYFGRQLNFNITKVVGTYKDNLHAFSIVQLSDGNCYFIDATRFIRGDKKKEECFLVSSATLNKLGDYKFKDEMVRGNDYLEVYPSYQCEVEELISAIKGIGLQVEDLNYSKQIVR